MAEMAQQTPLVIEVAIMGNLTDNEKTAIRRAVVRGNGLNIVLSGTNAQTRVIAVNSGITIGSDIEVVYYDFDEASELITMDCGEITAEDLSDDSPAE